MVGDDLDMILGYTLDPSDRRRNRRPGRPRARCTKTQDSGFFQPRRKHTSLVLVRKLSTRRSQWSIKNYTAILVARLKVAQKSHATVLEESIAAAFLWPSLRA